MLSFRRCATERLTLLTNPHFDPPAQSSEARRSLGNLEPEIMLDGSLVRTILEHSSLAILDRCRSGLHQLKFAPRRVQGFKQPAPQLFFSQTGPPNPNHNLGRTL